MHAFLADVHIQPVSAHDRRRFLSALELLKGRAERIYILGDLFEYWYGGLEEGVMDVIAALNDPRVCVMYGNRDFLLSAAPPFAGLITEEEKRVELYGKRLLLSHGHLLVQDDWGFKCLHALGWPVLRRLDAWLPPEGKRRLAEYLVRSSAQIRPPHGSISPGIARAKGVDTVICGHLHRGLISPELIVVPAFVDHAVYLGLDERGAAFYRLD